ncbi:hypothetical protein AB1A81_02425 [Bdellovibrio bacteriovorus]|nr:hypothetical protein [Bdellovibrio bacteriovorus]
MEQCREQISETSYSCDEKNDSGMSGIANTASQLSLMFGQQTAGSIQAACSKMASFSSAANAAVAAYRLNCQSAITSCRSACDQAVEFAQQNAACLDAAAGGTGISRQAVASAENSAKRCNDFDSKVQEANQAINNFAGTMQNAAQCASLTSGDSTALPELCKANPSLPGCEGVAAVDCTNPAMSGNKVCVCAKNPSDPVCMSEKNSAGSTFVSSTNPGSRLSTNGADLSGGDLPSLPSILPGKPGSGGAGEAVDGKQGGGAGISSMGGGGGGGASGGAAGEEGLEDGVQVNAGFYGGGGSFGGSGYGGGSGERNAAGMAGAAGAAKGKGGPDLSKFLPGGQYDPKLRGLAGSGGPDGITGPHSNIWQKIQNRYRVMSPTLLP